jgi:ubiquitin-protein ligase
MEDFVHYTLVNDTIEKKQSLIDVNSLLNNIKDNVKKSDSLFSPIEVGSSIIKELQKIEEKDNIFFAKNIIINNIYDISISNFIPKHPSFKLNLILDKDYYPLVPPQITITPIIDPIYMYELIHSPELDINNTHKIRNIEFVTEYIKTKLNEYNIICNLNNEITNEIIKLLTNNNFRFKQVKKEIIKQNIRSFVGIGYGGNVKNWDVNLYLNNINRIKNTNLIILSNIIKYISENKQNNDLLEIHNRFNLYNFWIDLLEKYDVTDVNEYTSIYYIMLIMKYLNLKINIPFLNQFIDINTDDKNESLINNIKNIINDIKLIKETDELIDNNYVKELKELQFGNYPYVEKEHNVFINEIKSFTNFVNNKTIQYITKQYKQLNTSLPLTNGSGVFFRQDSSNLALFKFLIIPNEDTPYKYGCFVFEVFLPSNFPNEPPKVTHITSKKNDFRFNPNLYADGKVCLSLLGTWGGQSQSEKWIAPSETSSGSTFLQLILSIYSMIFTDYPWYNEPGRERGISDALTNKQSISYNNEIKNGTIKYAIINQLKYPEYGFSGVINSHFKLKKNEIIEYMKKENIEETTINIFSKLC